MAAEFAQRIADLRPRLERLQDEARESRQTAVREPDARSMTSVPSPMTPPRTRRLGRHSMPPRRRQLASRRSRKSLPGVTRTSRNIETRELSSCRTGRATCRSPKRRDESSGSTPRPSRSRSKPSRPPDRLPGWHAASTTMPVPPCNALRRELARIVEMRDRLQHLAEEADRRGRESDELDRMYREFAEFDKFVADHVGPLLAETTERLLEPGHRGQIRSRSLRRELRDRGLRRRRVLQAGRLLRRRARRGRALRAAGDVGTGRICRRCGRRGSSCWTRSSARSTASGAASCSRRSARSPSSGHFQQMFIISHVDDVQQSPVMNEAWTIEERDGVSYVVRPQSLLGAAA